MQDILLWFGGVLSFGIASFVLLLLILLKTPALTFLKASLRKKILLAKFNPYGLLEIKTAEPGELAYVKGEGFYLTNPNVKYIEKTTRAPTFLVYGNYSYVLDPKILKITALLKEMGIDNIATLEQLIEEGKISPNTFVEHGISLEPKKVLELLKEKNIEDFNNIKIVGESVPIEHVVNFFPQNMHAGLIEAYVARRTAAEAARRMGLGFGNINWVKIGIFLFILLIGIAVAYSIFSGSAGQAATQASRIITQSPAGVGVG